MCNDDWNTGFKRCPGKISSLGGPTIKKNVGTKNPETF